MTFGMYLALTIVACVLVGFICLALCFFCYFLYRVADYFCAKYSLVRRQEDVETERYNWSIIFRERVWPLVSARMASESKTPTIKVNVRKVVKK